MNELDHQIYTCCREHSYEHPTKFGDDWTCMLRDIRFEVEEHETLFFIFLIIVYH